MGELLDYDHLRALVKLCKAESPVRLQQLNHRITRFIQGNHGFLTGEDINWLQHMWDTLLMDNSRGPMALPLTKVGGNIFDVNGFTRFDSDDIVAVTLLAVYIVGFILIQWRMSTDDGEHDSGSGSDSDNDDDAVELALDASTRTAANRKIPTARPAATSPKAKSTGLGSRLLSLLPTSEVSAIPADSGPPAARRGDVRRARRAMAAAALNSPPPDPDSADATELEKYVNEVNWVQDEHGKLVRIKEAKNIARLAIADQLYKQKTSKITPHMEAMAEEARYNYLLELYTEWYDRNQRKHRESGEDDRGWQRERRSGNRRLRETRASSAPGTPRRRSLGLTGADDWSDDRLGGRGY